MVARQLSAVLVTLSPGGPCVERVIPGAQVAYAASPVSVPAHVSCGSSELAYASTSSRLIALPRPIPRLSAARSSFREACREGGALDELGRGRPFEVCDVAGVAHAQLEQVSMIAALTPDRCWLGGWSHLSRRLGLCPVATTHAATHAKLTASRRAWFPGGARW